MGADPQCLDKQVKSTKKGKAVNELKSQISKSTQKYGKDKRDNLIIGNRGGKQANGHKGSPQEQQTNIGTQNTAHIQIPGGKTQLINREKVKERRDQRNDNQ